MRPFLILIVLDGFGCRDEAEWNAVRSAETPNFDELFRNSAWTTLEASGLRVGLPEGQMGNSEVGHLNIGGGRVVDQDIVRISKAVGSGALATDPLLVSTFERLKREKRAIHYVGLLSDGGVHSLQHHLHGLIDAAVANGMAPNQGRPSVFIHAILDGRDTPPASAKENVARLLAFVAGKPAVHLASLIGRYYTMDRDRRWERIQRGYDLMTLAAGVETSDPLEVIERFWAEGITDEFMEPISVLHPSAASGVIADGDAVLFFNFRADRMRQIVTTFLDDAFDGFERQKRPRVDLLSMTRYREDFNIPVIFPPPRITNHLGEVLAANGLRQLRIAETEKYAHVTYFFNGGSDTVSDREERVLIASPKVATYDLKPEMSLPELSARVVAEIESRSFDVVVMNIANPDMVGHTGKMEAAMQAVRETDRAVGAIVRAVDQTGGMTVITADHGNCELMFDPRTGQPHTAHTNFPVPLIIRHPVRTFRLRGGGALENVAPTLLELLGLNKPAEMTGASLLVAHE